MSDGGADIQLEGGGWSRIHNRIWELLAQANLTSREFRCLMFLFRQTYGYQKKADAISLSQWADGTGMQKHHVMSALGKLEERRIIVRIAGSQGRGKTAVYGFNKYHEQWISDTKKVPDEVPIKKVPTSVPFIEKKVPTGVTEKVPTGVPTKERKKQQAACRQLSEFVQAFQHFTGRPVSSPYEGERIQDWESRVTLDGWKSALEKTAQKRPTNFWRYLETILLDYEQNGYSAKVQPAAESQLDYTLEDLL
jgi:phage replication O-like protein O